MDASTIVSTVQAALPGAAIEVGAATDQPTLVVAREQLLEVCRILRDDAALDFRLLAEVTAVDWWPKEPRFEVIYHLASLDKRARLRLKVRVRGDEAHVPTVLPIWPSAGWLEREVWDLMGIAFDGHPDLRRVLMPEDWEGHPQRKDYPVQISMKPRVFEPLQLTQEEFQARLKADRHVRDALREAPGATAGDQGRDEPR
jgi:NADH-quinone oxidoreductase subunit C